LVAAATATAMLAVTGSASAAPASTSFAVSGSEYAFTSTAGSFAGLGNGNAGDRATWNATVVHDPLGSTPPIYIDGGSLTLDTISLTGADKVTASFVYHGGTITPINPGANCTNQTYAVTGGLENVATSTTSGGTGTFDVILTHYRTRIFGLCITYNAKVSGTATFAYS